MAIKLVKHMTATVSVWYGDKEETFSAKFKRLSSTEFAKRFQPILDATRDQKDLGEIVEARRLFLDDVLLDFHGIENEDMNKDELREAVIDDAAFGNALVTAYQTAINGEREGN